MKKYTSRSDQHQSGYTYLPGRKWYLIKNSSINENIHDNLNNAALMWVRVQAVHSSIPGSRVSADHNWKCF